MLTDDLIEHALLVELTQLRAQRALMLKAIKILTMRLVIANDTKRELRESRARCSVAQPAQVTQP